MSRRAGYKWIGYMDCSSMGDDQLWRERCARGTSCHCNCYMFWLFEMREKLQVDKALFCKELNASFIMMGLSVTRINWLWGSPKVLSFRDGHL